MRLFERLGGRIGQRPEGSHPHHQWQPARAIMRRALHDAGVRRVNVSLDTRDPDLFRRITRWGDLDKVMAGIERAAKAGLQIKINTVALKGVNEDEIPALMRWAHAPRFRLHPDRNHADGRGRRRPRRPLSAAVAGARAAGTRFHADAHAPIAPAARRAISTWPRPAGGWASSRPSPTISAKAATACASPAPACSICAWARTTAPICASRCAPRRPTTLRRSRHRRGDDAQAARPRFRDRPPGGHARI